MAYLIELIVSVGAQVIGYAYDRGIAAPSSARRRYDPPGAVCLVSSADRYSVSSVRACVPCLAWSALHLARPALLPVMCRPSGCAGGLGSPPAGYTGRAGGGVGHTRDKIFQRKRRFQGGVSQTTHPTFTNRNPSDCASLQNFRKIQKDPFRNLDCAIIS